MDLSFKQKKFAQGWQHYYSYQAAHQLYVSLMTEDGDMPEFSLSPTVLEHAWLIEDKGHLLFYTLDQNPERIMTGNDAAEFFTKYTVERTEKKPRTDLGVEEKEV